VSGKTNYPLIISYHNDVEGGEKDTDTSE